MVAPSVGILAVGAKGLNFTRDVLADLRVTFVQTYGSTTSTEPGVEHFERALSGTAISLRNSRTADPDDLASVDLVFAVGWQYLLTPAPPNLVVLHDSLLPRYRGFAPTVAALIEGDHQLGVTALSAAKESDAGDILAQAAVVIEPPFRIRAAFEALRPCYRDVALSVCDSWNGALPVGRPQAEDEATYSIWRDAADYAVDWTWDAPRIVRHIYAVGDPYPGARTTVDGSMVIVREAAVVADRAFVTRTPGKIWRLTDGGAEVVCGEGVVHISDLTDSSGAPFAITRLRTRLGS